MSDVAQAIRIDLKRARAAVDAEPFIEGLIDLFGRTKRVTGETLGHLLIFSLYRGLYSAAWDLSQNPRLDVNCSANRADSPFTWVSVKGQLEPEDFMPNNTRVCHALAFSTDYKIGLSPEAKSAKEALYRDIAQNILGHRKIDILARNSAGQIAEDIARQRENTVFLEAQTKVINARFPTF